MQHHDTRLSPSPFWASMIDAGRISEYFSVYANPLEFTRFEQLVIESIQQAWRKVGIDLTDDRTLLILSTTKGNVDMLDPAIGLRFETNRVYLWHTAKLVQEFFGFRHTPMVISNACISGVLAILIGARLIRANEFDHVVVTGADIVTEFVLS